MRVMERPVLRYHGGKWRIAEWIISHFPDHYVYVEPYGGAASVLMRKPRSRHEVYGEINGDIVNVFRVLRDKRSAERLREALILTPFAREEYDMSYETGEDDDDVERARKTIMRSLMGHGAKGLSNGRKSGWRSKRAYSTSLASDWASYPEQIRFFVERLRGVAIENRPALEVLKRYDTAETLHYVDPPYLLETRTANARDIYRYEMSDEDHAALSETLKSLKGMVVLSGYDSPLYRSLYADWEVETKNTMGDSGDTRMEFLFLSQSVSEKRTQKQLW
jgi:DNA adenine methylase